MLRKARFKELEGDVGALVGKDGWLFLTGDSNDALGQHTGRVVPPRGWERGWARLWRRRARVVRRLGAEYVQLIVPDKEAVYAEMHPASAELIQQRPVHRLLERARRSPVEVIYPLEELRAARADGPVFMPTDTHWTASGAYIAYRLICEALAARGLSPPVVGEDDVEWITEDFQGDLGVKLDPPRTGPFIRPRFPNRRARMIEDNRVRVTGRRMVLETDLADAPRLVVFGTSYAVAPVPFLAESASRLVFQQTTAFVAQTVQEERPDAVVVISAERGLLRTPEDRGAAEMLAEVVANKIENGVVVGRGPTRFGFPELEE